MRYDYKLKVCPVILHANLINAQQTANKRDWGYRLTNPKDEYHDDGAQCLGRRCMWFEWNDVCCWCGLTKD